MVYVDAQTGEILFDLPLIHFADEIGTAHTQYCGIKEINTFSNSSTDYILKDNTRGNGLRTLNCHMTTNYNNAWEFTDTDNIWNNVNPQLDEYATDAHYATMSTYDYYWDKFNRNSIDGNGFALWSYVHFNLVQAGYPDNVNAFWNGQCMTYGDGKISQGITPLTTLDICGHEVTHGLTNFTANLVYAYEPGALNEAFSDIFGTAIEFYAVPEYANWTIGEKIGHAFRSMSNPKQYQCPNTYKGQFWVSGGSDNGGVHTNSGVLNYWFYLLSEGGSGTNDNGNAYQVQGIGIEKAEQIAFKLLTEYLTPNSQYIDAFYYAVIAAAELYKDSYPQAVQSVGDAFYAVGVIADPFNSNVIFRASATSIREGDTVKFTDLSISEPTAWHWYFDGGTPPESHDQNPEVLYETAGRYDVKLVITNAQGTDSLLCQKYIKVIVSQPPIADFFADVTEIEEGGTVSFTNLSQLQPESYSWFFEGVTPTQSTQENPVVQYNKAGVYSVRLKATNEAGSSVEIKKNYITVTPKTAIEEWKVESGALKVYPNPTDGQLIIENGQLTIENIEILDMIGHPVGANLRVCPNEIGKSDIGKSDINISHLPTGVYFIRITTEEGTITRKIIKN
jgi:PKD repeat protein